MTASAFDNGAPRNVSRLDVPAARRLHMRATRADGRITAACVRHLKSDPTVNHVGDLMLAGARERVTCPLCQAAEVA